MEYKTIELFCYSSYDVQSQIANYTAGGWRLVTIIPPSQPLLQPMDPPRFPSGPFTFVFEKLW